MEKLEKIIWFIHDGSCGEYAIRKGVVVGKFNPLKDKEEGEIIQKGEKFKIICLDKSKWNGTGFTGTKEEIFSNKKTAEFWAKNLRSAYKWGEKVASYKKETEIKENILKAAGLWK